MNDDENWATVDDDLPCGVHDSDIGALCVIIGTALGFGVWLLLCIGELYLMGLFGG